MKRLLVPFLSCLLLCGCGWQDAGELSAVTAGAVSVSDGAYHLTAELAVPDADSAVPSSRLLSGTAQTSAQAVENVGKGQDAVLYWSHARVLLLDESALAAGIGESVRAWYALPAIRPSVALCAVREGSAADVLQCASVSGEPMGFALGDSLTYAVQGSQTPQAPLYRVYNALQTDGMDPVLPAVTIKDGAAMLDGCALFSGDRLAGWLDAEETAALALLLGDGETARLPDDGGAVSLSRIHVSVSASDGLRISVRADAACQTDADASHAAELVKTRCAAVLDRLRETNCDALGLGRLTDGDWRQQPVTLDVTIHAAQSGEGDA